MAREVISGIYEIRNTLNNHRYVGSSANIYKRFWEHLNSLQHNKHHSGHLQNAWNKYGENHFEFNILETCEPIKDTLLFIEQKYLDLKPEYNICKIAGNTKEVIFSEERNRKIGLANKNRIISKETRCKYSINAFNSEWNKKQRKSVIMMDLNNNVILEFNSICQAAIYTGHINHRVGIKRVLNSDIHKAYGYKWKLKN